ncbi:ABC transporter substrate-binding protein [Micromonospora sp. WMMD1082]|uniref:ABC transporter substrate-binding protein n=1 Tax=Micromonospora sp. WMMD1082 TaxID=3016104 RepID=UPI002416D60D|nr:ABC transporter substrate-binding protein [Micromonospora sp. WMMD1082]MDG4795126.1 ABC transporter substrate-binding protein [Micromonospora sp. WMMD1082]
MSPSLTRRTLMLGGVAAAAGLMGACGSDSNRRAPSAAVDEVSVLTGAAIQGREAPIFVARQKGWFKEQGLEVSVLAGSGTTENLKLLASGQATFATLDVSGAMIEYAKKDGIKNFKLTSVLHQQTLAAFVARRSSGISIASDLAGRTISYIPGGINFVLFNAYARLAGFDPNNPKITWVANPVAPQHAVLLAQRRVEAISAFVPAVEVIKSVVKEELTVLPFGDYVTDLHGSAIGVTDQTAQTRPDVVRRFNSALIQGLRYAIEHPDEAGEIYATQPETKGQPASAAVAELTTMKGYVQGNGQVPIGRFDQARVARNIAILRGAGEIPPGLTPLDIVAADLAG